MFIFTFSMAINRNTECMQMSPVAACAWSVAGKSHDRLICSPSHSYNLMTSCYL